MEDSQSHEYFFHLFGKELLEAFIAETNLLEGQILSKVHLVEVALSWKPKRVKNIYYFLVKQLVWD